MPETFEIFFLVLALWLFVQSQPAKDRVPRSGSGGFVRVPLGFRSFCLGMVLVAGLANRPTFACLAAVRRSILHKSPQLRLSRALFKSIGSLRFPLSSLPQAPLAIVFLVERMQKGSWTVWSCLHFVSGALIAGQILGYLMDFSPAVRCCLHNLACAAQACAAQACVAQACVAQAAAVQLSHAEL